MTLSKDQARQKKWPTLHSLGSLEEWHWEVHTVCCSAVLQRGDSPGPGTSVATDLSQGQMPALQSSLLVEDEKSNVVQHCGA